MKLEINGTRRPTHDTSHDRLSVLRNAHCTLIALADGADSGRGAQVAAARAVNELALCFRNGALPEHARDWVMILETIDRVALSDPDAGETSALVMLVQRGIVVGASIALGPAAHDVLGQIQLLLFGTAAASFFAMQFTGATTFTSPSGVEWEMRRALPFQLGAVVVATAIGLWRLTIG